MERVESQERPSAGAEKGTVANRKVYREWDTQDVSSWLKEQLKLPQYCETFCKSFLGRYILWRNVG